jgi:hypothetical protein
MDAHHLNPTSRCKRQLLQAFGLLVLSLWLLAACRKGDQNVRYTATPTCPPLVLEDLILPEDAVPGYHYYDLTTSEYYKPGMKNPWLLQGADIQKRSNLIHGIESLNPDRLTAILMVTYTNGEMVENIGYWAMQSSQLTAEEIEAYRQHLLLQGSERFRLYISGNTMLVVWSNAASSSLAGLAQQIETRYSLSPVSLERDNSRPIDTSITTSYNLLQNPERCTASTTCSELSVAQSCLTCPGGKIAFSKGCTEAPGFVQPIAEQGVCVQTHMLGSGYDSLYTGECMPFTAFCLVPFDDQEVATVSSAQTLRYLPLWKQALLQRANIPEDYFRQHFYVRSADLHTWGSDQLTTSFNVTFSFHMDWITVQSTDRVVIQPAGSAATVDDAAILDKFVLTFRQPIEQAVSRDQAVNLLTTGCEAGLTFDESRDFRWQDGRLELEASAVIDLQANHCKRARLDLETGEILECSDVACVVY